MINFYVWLTLTLLNAVIIGLCYLQFDRWGLLIGLGLATLMSSILYFRNERSVLKQFTHREVRGNDSWNLNPTVEEFARKIRLEKPTIAILDGTHSRIMTLGSAWEPSYILISEHLLKKLSAEEIMAVLALAVAHLKAKDRYLVGLIIRLNFFVIACCQFLDKTISLGWIRTSEFHFFERLVGPLMMTLSTPIYRESSAFSIDEKAAELAGDNRPVAEILVKLESYVGCHPYHVPFSQAHMYFIDAPLETSAQNHWLSLFPSVQARVKHLVGHYPI